MKTHTVWRASFALPLVCPAIAYGILWVSGKVGEPPLIASQTLFTITMSGYLLGIPYALFAGILLALLWSRPLSAYKRAALIAPILFDFVLIASVAMFILASHGDFAETLSSKFQAFYILELVLGYAYVGVVFVGAWLLIRFRVVEQPGATREHSA